jgi:hypothetical protein
MVADVTSTFTANNTAIATKTVGSTIDAASFRAMVNTLDALIQHSHTFTDDYTSNCQCNCQRGSI